MAKRWTTEEEELVKRLWHDGLSLSEIASQVGRSYASVQTVTKKHGLTRRSNHPLTSEEIEFARLLWRDGLTIRKIAARIGHPETTLKSYIDKHRADFPHRYDISGTDWVPAAIEMRKQGMTLQQIANKCGVNWWVVQRRLAIAGVAKP